MALTLCALLVAIAGAAAGLLAGIERHRNRCGADANDFEPLSPADQLRIWRGIEARMTETERRERFESECG